MRRAVAYERGIGHVALFGPLDVMIKEGGYGHNVQPISGRSMARARRAK